ncbi:recombinase family protein [Hydrogenophaga electricum]|uniref:recombinase family protein n=1 Tax=Hydrogenophaga electricum TaxID=1230953 RepID=UPI00351A4D14
MSTIDQDTALQLDALKGAGVKQIYQDKSSGVGPRPQLRQVIASLRQGDTLVVWKLDRVARSLSDLLTIIDQVKQAGASIKSLTEPIDTSNPIGQFTLQVLGAVAELERSMIRERTRAGVRAAIARGAVWGRPPRISDRTRLEVRYLVWYGWPKSVVADAYGISRGMVWNISMFHPNHKKPSAKLG